jgi:hypothetical protein
MASGTNNLGQSLMMRNMSVESIDWGAEQTKPRGETMNSLGELLEAADEDDVTPYAKNWFLDFKNAEEEADYQYFLASSNLHNICIAFFLISLYTAITIEESIDERVSYFIFHTAVPTFIMLSGLVFLRVSDTVAIVFPVVQLTLFLLFNSIVYSILGLGPIADEFENASNLCLVWLFLVANAVVLVAGVTYKGSVLSLVLQNISFVLATGSRFYLYSGIQTEDRDSDERSFYYNFYFSAAGTTIILFGAYRCDKFQRENFQRLRLSPDWINYRRIDDDLQEEKERVEDSNQNKSIFICYAGSDEAMAKILAQRLVEAGYIVKRSDGRGLKVHRPAQKGRPAAEESFYWSKVDQLVRRKYVAEGIKDALCVMFVISPLSVQSTAQNEEIHFAGKCGKEIFPLVCSFLPSPTSPHLPCFTFLPSFLLFFTFLP